MKINTVVSLLIGAVALGMQPAHAQRPDRQVVREVEVALDKAGYYVGNTSGDFTGDTRTAVESFQKVNALPVTGTITPDVLKALDLE